MSKLKDIAEEVVKDLIKEHPLTPEDVMNSNLDVDTKIKFAKAMKDELMTTEEAITTDAPVTDSEIIEGINIPFQPIDGRVLIKPLETIMLTKEVTEIDEEASKEARIKAKEESEKSGDPLNWPEAVTKTVTKEVESSLHIGVILAIGEEEGRALDYKPPYSVGDKVVYLNKVAMPFDLFKDSVLIKRYEIFGKWVA